MNVLLASNNNHKRKEIEGIVRAFRISIRLFQPADFGFSYDCEEHGDTFAANAYAKAMGLWQLVNGVQVSHVTATLVPQAISGRVQNVLGTQPLAVLADDSGLCVNALFGGPGVKTARYGADLSPPAVTDQDRYELLLRELERSTDRTAYYVCNAVLITGADQYVQVQDVWHGEIAPAPQFGETGFGYDPVFRLPHYDRTVAQIPQEQKDRVSHRAKAVSGLFRAAALTAT